MTTNKPEVVAWGIFFGKTLQEFGYTQEAAEAIAKTEYSDVKVTVEPLIRLSDYEALQAENEKLRKDAERLQWVTENWFYQTLDETWIFSFDESWDAGKHLDLRATIDSAMED